MFLLACLAHLVTTHVQSISGQAAKMLGRSILVFGSGFCIPLMLCVLYFWVQGGLPDFLFWTHSANLSYTGLNAPLAFLRSDVFFLRAGILTKHLADLKTHLMGERALPYLMGVVMTPILLVVRRSWIDVVTVFWLLSAILSSALNLQGPHAHYQVFYQVPCALACAVTLKALASFLPSRRGFSFVGLICLIFFFFSTELNSVLNSARLALRDGVTSPTYDGYLPLRHVMTELEKHAGENPRILFLSSRVEALFCTKLLPAS